MTNDPLAQYRRTTLAAGNGTLPPSGGDEYAAFGTKDKVHRLRIRSAAELTHSPGYNLLLDVVYDGQKGTHFMLVYTVLMVLVQGRNLQKVIYAIENGMADHIQEFDAARWQRPADEAAPVIESIEIKVVEGNMAGGNTEH
jgi:hypothetical protein